ncbi:ribonuclease iii [Fusarium sporotrichioides]|uniref:Ribonuclease iii n=1 Tax=Fusarium sporotrichioides TaxID=5514 RepID=A0A395RPK0_FUSSP|nr:ribonuclease iii [Fusarium sporotrichioides]
MSKRPAEEPVNEPRKRVQVAVASVASVAPGISQWSSTEIPDSLLPPLPPISPDLEEQVFRHPGLGGPNWERLEWYGDATLEMLSTEFIFETFPHLPSGRCSQIREQLVRNVTLAGYYREYGMEHKTQLPADLGKMPDLLRTKKNSNLLVKIQGDVFEAYVGAVVKSGPQGAANAVAWLKILWGRTIKDQIKQAERHRETVAQIQSPTTQEQSTQPKAKVIPLTWQNAKSRLSATIAVPGIKIQYKDMPCKKRDKDTGASLHAVGVYLDGWGETNKYLAFGVAVGKPEAGGRAALQALENRKLMQVYEAKKKQWVEEKAGARKADSDSL